MDFKVVSLVFNFLLLCWPKTNLVSRIRQHYGHNTLTLLRKLERTYLKLKKAELDIIFINKCQQLGLIPVFCRIKPANLQNLSTGDIRSLQSKILSMELKHKYKVKSGLKRTYISDLSKMKPVMSFFYYISILAFIRNSGKSHGAHVTRASCS